MKENYTPKEKAELLEQRELEMSFMLPNQFTFCLGTKVTSKPIIIKSSKGAN